MPQQLPPLNALRAFEAVARLKSFTKAATELYVTRAAISHQIKHLEDYLGFELIERHNRSISLTPAGAAALPKLREGFNNLADAVREMLPIFWSSSAYEVSVARDLPRQTVYHPMNVRARAVRV